MIGKRKRDTSVVSRSTTVEDEEVSPPPPDTSAQDVFRKFFEAQFQPLEVPKRQATDTDASEEEDEDEDDESEDGDTGSEWDGLSGDEGASNAVEVISYADSAKTEAPLDKKARKAFMTAKPPSFEVKATSAKRSPSKDEDEDGIDAADADNLKNDLALQRLLKESHLLESGSDLAPTGKNRLKALDLRMQSLGAKTSLYHQKMPSSHRRGIKAKAEKREERRRLEAKENGIILEKPTPKSKTSVGRRERGVGGPTIGKFSGGTLNLSKRDLSAIQKPRRSGKGKTRGRR
ncbi:conserved hypothetical protein [Aspergillus terreus NIH2624]|uniref:Protein FAF1 n=1 Tax=Aspergillus terreus (strain NIH 2624 / FGSC A1156) TaxID=341663 RepID=Q0CA72_ASPTN|nr:uncharacterized protein ATEG_09412 [Aspergillus terreus NIH2624]EAU30549.1 conserved hypothetical protein [Aspergillus terreus NIH2624]